MCNKRETVIQQLELMERIRQKAGINIVTCGHCGSVILHEQKPIGVEQTINCYDCGNDMDTTDCPDLFYTGMENSTLYDEPEN